MIYSLANSLEKEQAITRFNYLLENKKKIELKVKNPKRSISQNSYLHLILSAFGLEFGYTLEEVKQEIFKKEVNPEIFYDGEAGKLKKIERFRSSSDLDSKEMTIAIERFLNYSAKHGYRLPEPKDLIWIEELEKQVNNAKQYL